MSLQVEGLPYPHLGHVSTIKLHGAFGTADDGPVGSPPPKKSSWRSLETYPKAQNGPTGPTEYGLWAQKS